MNDLLIMLEYLAARYGWIPATIAMVYYLDCNWMQGTLMAIITFFAAKGNYTAGYAICWSKYNDLDDDEPLENN